MLLILTVLEGIKCSSSSSRILYLNSSILALRLLRLFEKSGKDEVDEPEPRRCSATSVEEFVLAPVFDLALPPSDVRFRRGEYKRGSLFDITSRRTVGTDLVSILDFDILALWS